MPSSEKRRGGRSRDRQRINAVYRNLGAESLRSFDNRDGIAEARHSMVKQVATRDLAP